MTPADLSQWLRLTRHLKIGMPGQRMPIVPMPPATVKEREKELCDAPAAELSKEHSDG